MVEVGKFVGNKIRAYRKQRNMTQKELGEKLGVKHNTVSAYESATNEPEQDMLFRIAAALDVNINNLFPPRDSSDIGIPHDQLHTIPILGKVPAGTPNIVEEDIIGYMLAPPDKRNSNKMMYLEVSSDSMNLQFPVGSYVLVDTESQIENGDIAVVKLNGDEATLKQVKFDYTNNKMFLIPHSTNNEYYPDVVDINENEVTLVGKVIGMYQTI